MMNFDTVFFVLHNVFIDVHKFLLLIKANFFTSHTLDISEILNEILKCIKYRKYFKLLNC